MIELHEGVSIHEVVALGAALAFVVVLSLETRTRPPRRGPSWHVLAGLALLFLGFSVLAIVLEGPIGFWPEHSRNLWGNQIWLDLLIAAGVAWCLLLPRLAAVGMCRWRWLALLAATGSFGLLVALARIRYLEEQQPEGEGR